MSSPTESPPTGPATAPGSRPPGPRVGRWKRRITLVLLVLAAAGAGGWRYRVTRPDYRLARGQEAVQQRDWDEVDAIADRLAAAGHPDRAYLLRGEAFHARHRPDLALAEFNQIRGEGPLRLRAATLTGRCLIDLGELKEAHRVLSYVVAEEPDNPDAHRGLAVIAYTLGQLADAVDHLERVARLDPQDGRPHRLIGLIHKDLARKEEAVDAYREALRRGLSAGVAAEVRGELAEVLMQQAKYDEALATLDTDPAGEADDQPAQLVVRAECLRGLGRQKEAADLLDRGLSKHESAPLYRLRGQVRLDAGDDPGAVRPLERAVDLAPAEYQSHFLLAKAYSGVGRRDDAARELARAEDLRQDLDRITALSREAMDRPWDAGVRLRLADLSDRLGKPQLAAMWRSAAAACAGPKR
ncbi:MAG: tetratricopeptide repeat protein [Gemmataceae bacterium]|nr:tetratricopeptide repeat protein [Gemmataceae bacterium]